MSEAHGFSSFGDFSNAIENVSTANNAIDTAESDIKACQSQLSSGSIFMGPIADSCKDEFGKISAKISSMKGAFNDTASFLSSASDEYKTSVNQAVKEFKSAGSTTTSTKSGNTQASDLHDLGDRANNGDKTAQKEFLDKMSSVVDPYCKKYGFPKSVMLAQIIQESGWDKSGSWLNDNNNILNVNSEMFGSRDYVVAKDGTRNDSVSIPKWASNPKHATGSVSGGAYFEAPRVDSMRAYDCIEDCVEDYLGLMVGYRPELKGSSVDGAIEGVKHYAEDAKYADNLHNAINRYNLTQYDV